MASPGFNSAYNDPARVSEYLDVATARIAAMPGVERTALSEATLIGLRRVSISLREGRALAVNLYATTPEYLEILGVRLLRGRLFTRDEVVAHAPVAVISDNLARELWPGEDPIGETLPPAVRATGVVRIIGVATSAATTRLRDSDDASVYRPLGSLRDAQVVIRVTGAGADAVAPIRDALRAIDPALRPRVRTVASSVQMQLDNARAAATIGVALGLTALAMSVAGIFGVTAFLVGQRTREISVRMAIGATRRDLLALLLRQSLRPVIIGLVIGLGAAALANRVLEGGLGAVSIYDPLAFITAPAVLMLAAGVAVMLPARRAATIDPALVLRQ